MKKLSKLIMAGCLVCAAPLVQACDMGQPGAAGGMFFKDMDKNGDGAISKQEFDAFHSAHFKAMDANKDGKVSFKEEQDYAMKHPDDAKKSYLAAKNGPDKTEDVNGNQESQISESVNSFA